MKERRVTYRFEARRIVRGVPLETLLDVTAKVTVVVGSFIVLAAIVAVQSLEPMIMLAGLFFQWLFLRCIAEHIRLQKKIAGIDFAGRISGPRLETIWACGHCNSMLHSENHCDNCGARIKIDSDD
ncbi:hypothetical protein [Stieleria varia]|uniref:Uncharacterized protein n=1 Tax=Stieleria varia TaxID=2528005 RepID=A0A5C6AXV0_9BACT|nr:hypothetical protein [Stieleria varia]TWU04287.1 hypothetical protein Pla52n_23260 [Stieleria varia]